jgi:hypothetical protein
MYVSQYQFAHSFIPVPTHQNRASHTNATRENFLVSRSSLRHFHFFILVCLGAHLLGVITANARFPRNATEAKA